MKVLLDSTKVSDRPGFATIAGRSDHKEIFPTTPACEAARARLLAVRGDPFLRVRWEPSVFLHFNIDPELLRHVLPKIFELDIREGVACVSLAAVRMRQFRPYKYCSSGLLFLPLQEQRFLNLRIYGKWRDEPGVLFLHGWLSRPGALPLPSGLLDLSYTFATLNYEHRADGVVGEVTAKSSPARFRCSGRIDAPAARHTCPGGSLAEFAMERYSGFFVRHGRPFVFRVWHPPWQQVPLRLNHLDTSLVVEKFPWFRNATFAGANLTDAIPEVWMGGAHRLREPQAPQHGSRHVLSAFYDMP